MNYAKFDSIDQLLNEKNTDKYYPIVALQRVEANEHFRTASMLFSEPGLYKVIFDNSYSYFRSKEIYYSIHLLAKDVESIL